MADKPVTADVGAGSQYNATVINDNFGILEDAIAAGIGRGGTAEANNSMQGDLDLDLNQIKNLPSPQAPRDAASKEYVDGLVNAGGTLATTLVTTTKFSGFAVDWDAVLTNRVVSTVETYTELAGLSALIANAAVVVLGRNTKSDGGGGVFYWDDADLSTEVSADPQAGIYKPPSSDVTGASGCFVRLYNGILNVIWFGAKPDDLSFDQTAQFHAAKTYAATLGGSEIIVPRGDYALNLQMTSTQGIIWRGVGGTGNHDTLTNARLQPWSITDPIVLIGDDSATVQGGLLDSLTLFAEGPNGDGECGLHVGGGAREINFENLAIHGAYTVAAVDIVGGATRPITQIEFDACKVQVDAGAVGNAFRCNYGATYATAIMFNNGKITGPTTGSGGFAINLDSVQISMQNTWVAATADHGINLAKSYAPAPRIWANSVTVDSDNSNDVLLDVYGVDRLISAYIRGGMNIDGRMRLSDATVLQQGVPGTPRDVELFNPRIVSKVNFAHQTDPALVDMSIYRSDGTSVMWFVVPNGGSFKFYSASGAVDFLVPINITKYSTYTAIAASSVANNSIFLDSADNIIKIKDNTGAVKLLY